MALVTYSADHYNHKNQKTAPLTFGIAMAFIVAGTLMIGAVPGDTIGGVKAAVHPAVKTVPTRFGSADLAANPVVPATADVQSGQPVDPTAPLPGSSTAPSSIAGATHLGGSASLDLALSQALKQ